MSAITVSSSTPVFRFERVGRHFGRTVALHDVSFCIEEGQRWVVFGRNGAGKSTLLQVASGLLRASEGQVFYRERPVSRQRPALQREAGLLSHATGLYDDLTAEENLVFFARLYQLESPQQRVRKALEQVGLERRAREPVRKLSRGMQQRLAVARAFLHQPRVLFLDEPFTGLDAPSAALLLARIGEEKGATVLLSSHDLEQGLALASHVAILDRGQVVYQGKVSSTSDSECRSAYRRWVEGVLA